MFKRSPLLLAAVTGALMLGVAGTALAVDRVSFEYGTTDDDRASADRYGATVAWNLGGEWLKLGQFSLTTYIEAGLNVWDGDKGTTGNGTNVDGHVTPVLRLQRELAKTCRYSSKPVQVFMVIRIPKSTAAISISRSPSAVMSARVCALARARTLK